MIHTSEWVSTGHPDKMADFISCYILDRYLEKDPMTRYALEVQIKDNFVSLAGEITSKAEYSGSEIADFVREAVKRIGYTRKYQLLWGEENTISGENVLVDMHISHQSADIAQGVDADGWGDQGIFFGMAVNSPDTSYLPLDWWLARKIGKMLFDRKVGGLDIKTQVTVEGNEVREVVVAIPMLQRHSVGDVANIVTFCLGGRKDYDLHINGTGRFVKHGPVGDCGMTGRKLAVDFYGGNCKIGGGCPWTKDATKADLTLNILARQIAVGTLFRCGRGVDAVYSALSCRIGSSQVMVSVEDGKGNEIEPTTVKDIKPNEVIEKYALRTPKFAWLCEEGLFH